nr:malate:quinone oxidoreductase [Arthrobacter sp. FB24]
MTAEMRTETAPAEYADVVLVGAGIMSMTLGVLLKELQPSWSIAVVERLGSAGGESSDSWNNAGTGHAALCELNYTPAGRDGTVSPDKAIAINEQFQVSLQFWAHLAATGRVGAPKTFINPVPHMSFVWGGQATDYLHRRYEALKPQPLFSTMEFSDRADQLEEWTPLVMTGRRAVQPVAGSRVAGGTDVDFGALSRTMAGFLQRNGAELNFEHEVTDLARDTNGRWDVSVHNLGSGRRAKIRSRFVFIGAGGGALHLLQRSGIPEGRGFGGFPVSGQFLRCTKDEIVRAHHAKVYGQASVGAPPMSVPHLDTRVVDGKRSLLFGPYAGFTSRFLKSGSLLDLPRSIRPSNLGPMLAVARDNLDLSRYLLGEVLKSREAKIRTLTDYMPTAQDADWDLITAGQRVQIIRKDPTRGGALQFGTELITSGDGSLAALLGASPGASTSVSIVLDLLERSFPQQFPRWQPRLTDMIPGYGHRLNDNPALAEEVLARTGAALQLHPGSGDGNQGGGAARGAR